MCVYIHIYAHKGLHRGLVTGAALAIGLLKNMDRDLMVLKKRILRYFAGHRRFISSLPHSQENLSTNKHGFCIEK